MSVNSTARFVYTISEGVYHMRSGYPKDSFRTRVQCPLEKATLPMLNILKKSTM